MASGRLRSDQYPISLALRCSIRSELTIARANFFEEDLSACDRFVAGAVIGADVSGRSEMAFATISTWKMGADMDAAEMAKIMQDQFMPALRSLGATQAMTVQTGKDTSAIISVYPDEATRNSAMEKIKALREKGASTFSAEMTGELMGTVIASA